MKRTREARLLPYCLSLVLLAMLLAGCEGSSSNPGSATAVVSKPNNAIEVTMSYSSEKKPWLEPLVVEFNRKQVKAANGKPIFVTASVGDSGTIADQIAQGQNLPTVWSPSTSLWIAVVNQEADRTVLDRSDPLLLTPVVMAMWKPMAQALGWPDKPIGLSDIIELNNSSTGWGAKGHPEWGKFKYAHTNPDVSSTGLSAVTAEFYAAVGKVRDLNEADVNDPKVKTFIESIENSIVHYSKTTTIFKENVEKGGMDYISAVAFEEVTVIELNKKGTLKTPLVAIYPKEGTFYHDNPFIVPLATPPDAKAAAEIFKQYLLQADSQRAAVQLGFRPANPDVKAEFAAAFNQNVGVDATQPKSVLDVPSPQVLIKVKNAWKDYRKQANVVLVLDISGSMGSPTDTGSKFYNALEGLKVFLDQTRAEDNVGFITFADNVDYLVPLDKFSTTKDKITAIINARSFQQGGTALYDAVGDAVTLLQKKGDSSRINAVVVLTDGQDTNSIRFNQSSLATLLSNNNDLGVRVFPIAYGASGEVDVNALQRMADLTRTILVRGGSTDIRQIYDQISKYF